MSLSSLLQRLRPGPSSKAAGGADAAPMSQSDVEAERVRARRRLIGMVVLVGAGVIGFPWLFETQPRPMASDIQVVQAPTGSAEASSSGQAGSASRSVAGKVAVAGIVEAPPPPPPAVEPAPAPVQAPAVSAVAPEPREVPVASKPAPRPAEPVKPSVKDVPKAQAPQQAKEKDKDKGKDAGKTASKDVAAKAASRPTDKGAEKGADKATTRYVVQFGAFADAGAAQAARMKVERLGIKTYAQQVDTPAGKRIRVRVGPYTDKAEADKAMATVRKAGLVGALLTL